MAQQNNNIDNLSDVFPVSGTNANVSPTQLPIRGEKRIINAPVDPTLASIAFLPAAPVRYENPQGRTQPVEYDDFYVSAALAPFVDYVVVRLYNRGLDGNGQPDGTPAVYRFLINPSQVVVNRVTLDGQAFARAGWQIGVWGEDSLSISLTGKTAGQYWAFGTTDRYQPFTESYRNLEQLQVVFENNGYWFEGEQAAEGPLATDFSRRIIKMHSDVELIVGNFIWYGMFESLTISQNAEEPFLMDFQISFVAWKERFRQSSPYQDTIHNDVKRGHDFGTWQRGALTTQQAGNQSVSQSVALTPNTATPIPAAPSSMVPPKQITPTPPAKAAAQDANTYPQVTPQANDTTFIDPVLGVNLPLNTGNWNYVLAPLNIGNGGNNTNG